MSLQDDLSKVREIADGMRESLCDLISDLTASFVSTDGWEDRVCFWCDASVTMVKRDHLWIDGCDHADGCPYVRAKKVLEER